jgi:thiol-disulfide isomerase/thioredoxin
MGSKRMLATAALTVAAVVCAAGAATLPAAASTTAATTTENTPQPGGPLIHPSSSTSKSAAASTTPTIAYNWSGYAVTGKKPYTYVHSTFVQPSVTCSGVADQYTSNWVGLDGYNNGTVEQDGTAAWCGGTDHTTPKYEAWYEMYPANSVNTFAVHPGDVIDVTVAYSDSTSDFTLTVRDLSTGKSATDTAACADCARASAEWIIERPALCNKAGTKCFITELADFGTSTMTGDEAQVEGGTVKGVGAFNNYAIYMVNPDANGDGGFYSLDNVGPVSGKSFAATWLEPGTTIPISL